MKKGAGASGRSPWRFTDANGLSKMLSEFVNVRQKARGGHDGSNSRTRKPRSPQEKPNRRITI